jgi:heme-degrading monooxygenase HmoA
MKFVLINHEVDDYARWKLGFDEAAEKRRAAGEISFQVLRFEGQPNRVVHFSRWASLAQARDFFESDEVAEIRKSLGVQAPEFNYLEELEAGVL